MLAHNYQTPEIFHGIADVVGDSLALAQQGAKTDADVIVLCGVHFMAETAKVLSPEKTVLIPDLRAGCSLAESITGADVRLLKERYPGVPVVTYVNTSADVKAESDVCCTSANAVEVVESLGVERVIFLPDEYLGKYVASQTKVQLILWKGHCEVHERFTGGQIRGLRAGDPTLYVLAHPECPPDVLAEADFVGSTAGMIRHLGEPGRAPRGDGHRVLDERQRRRRASRRRFRAALQPLPAHEAHHAAQGSARAADDGARGDGGARGGSAGQGGGGADAGCWPRRQGLMRSCATNSDGRAMATKATASAATPAGRGADAIVVGGGVAGLAAALAMRAPAGRPQPRVLLVSKTRFSEGGASNWAQGGVAAAMAAGDTPWRHAADTVAVAGGIADRAAVELLTTRGPQRLRELLASGARFDRDAGGELALGREAAHSAPRILHAGGDATGAEMVRALAAAVRGAEWIEVLDETFAEELLVDGGRVVGLLVRRLADGGGGRALTIPLAAGAVVLATGGIGQAWRFTTNPAAATGDGLAMAARAGARLADLEFVQFHPTALAAPRDPLPLLTEALRGEGATLLDGRGRRFMLAEHPLAELAPRDVVARAIFRRRQAGEPVFLDATDAVGERFPSRFPTVFARCREQGFDPRVDPLPVTPAAHYHMGGVAVDLRGRTSLPGLWACGEVASTGAHGANRLASNSLLEALVFGAEVGEDVAAMAPERSDLARLGLAAREAAARMTSEFAPRAVELASVAAAAGSVRRSGDLQGAVGERAAQLRLRVRQLLWDHVGVERDADGLAAALGELDAIAADPAAASGELRNLVTVGRLVAAAALLREESRGAHWRRDFPAPSPGYAQRTLATADELSMAAAAATEAAEQPELAAAHC